MIKESKYIIRRILIGVGIVLVLGFLNGCKVKAFDYNTDNAIYTNTVSYNGRQYNYYWFFNNENNSLDLLSGSTNITSISLSELPYFVLAGSYSNTLYQCENEFTNILNTSTDNNSCHYYLFNMYSGAITSQKTTFNNEQNSPPGFVCNFDIYYKNYPTYLACTKNIDTTINLEPDFVSWNFSKTTTNNVITGYTFRPEFTNFDTDNYSFYYKFGNSNWLSLSSNQQLLEVNANGTIYVKIVHNESNTTLDTATFTITDLGTFNDPNVDFDIKITGEYRTENYINNQITSSSQSIIKEYQLYIDYFPKNSILKYQYQYVLENNSLDSNDWQNVASSDNGSKTYVTNQNGTLYARILDSQDNVLSTATFTVNSIGKFALDNNDTKIDNFFTKISNKINYGGPISSLFHIPVELLSSLYSSMFNSNTCTPFSLNQLLGVNMKYDCINFKSIVGNDFYNIIDMIFTFIISIGIFKFIIKLYNNLVSMNDIS